MNSFFQKLLQFLRSIRFINFLLILLAFTAAFGTLPNSFKRLPFPPEDIFHQKWFLVLLGYLAFASAWYAIQRTKRLLKDIRYSELKSTGQAQQLELPVRFGVPFHLISSNERLVSQAISDQKYDLKIEKKREAFIISAWKNRWGIWGGPLIHVGFTAVLLGGLLTFLFSDVRDVMIPEGETMMFPGSRTKMKLEKFAILFHSNQNKPENYMSRLLIEKNGKEIMRKDLSVNHPVRIGQTKLFQMRYRAEVLSLALLAYREGKAIERIELKPKEKKELSQFPLLVQVDEVIPDFIMNSEGKVSSRTPYFRNPAALISIYSAKDSEKLSQTTWAFQNLVHQGEKKSEEWSFVIEKIKKRYISGIKFSRDPGVSVAYTGFILLILGGFISGFVLPRQFLLIFRPVSEGHQVQMEVLYHRTKDLFGLRRDFAEIKGKFTKALKVSGV